MWTTAGLQPYSDPDVSDNAGAVRNGSAQTTGFVEGPLRLIDLDWAVPDFSKLRRRQKTLKVNIPYLGSAGPCTS